MKNENLKSVKKEEQNVIKPEVVKTKTKRWNERQRTFAVCDGPSKTQQSHKETVDVNNIIARFDRTGQLPPAKKEGRYGDVTMLNGNLQEVLDKANMTLEEADTWIEEYISARELQKAEDAEHAEQAAAQQTDPHHSTDDSASESAQ
jgi:hypothetical protein